MEDCCEVKICVDVNGWQGVDQRVWRGQCVCGYMAAGSTLEPQVMCSDVLVSAMRHSTCSSTHILKPKAMIHPLPDLQGQQ